MHQSFKDVPSKEFNNTEIIGTCFYNETVNAEIFPSDMTGVTFSKCNLDNIKIPVGNTVEASCCIKRVKVQNDNEDWILDNDLKPVEPLDIAHLIKEGKSIDPKDIPIEKAVI